MTSTTKSIVTADTGETVTAAVLTDYHAGDGYEWMDRIVGAGWVPVPNWGSQGWDLGQWPYVIVTVATTTDGERVMYGVGTYCEGDTSTTWYRTQAAQWEAITEHAFFSWTMGQAAGPADLPATAAGLPDRDRRPYPGWTATE